MNAFIVAKSDKAFATVVQVLKMCGSYRLIRTDSIAQARVFAGQQRFGIAVICADSRDAGYREIAGMLTAGGCGTVFIAAGGLDDGALELYDCGVQVVARPVTTTALYGAIRTAQGVSNAFRKLWEENAALKEKVETLKAVGKAKCLLVIRGMTEEEAHREIERRAMEQRKTRLEIALGIIERNASGT